MPKYNPMYLLTHSLDWDGAMALVRLCRPDLSQQLTQLDEMGGLEETTPAPPELWPVAQLMFLAQTDPLTDSRH